MGDFAKAWHAAGELTLLQGQQVTLVQAVHGVSTHPPVKVVHSLSLRQSTALGFIQQHVKYSLYSNTCTLTPIVYRQSQNHAVQTQGAASKTTFSPLMEPGTIEGFLKDWQESLASKTPPS